MQKGTYFVGYSFYIDTLLEGHSVIAIARGISVTLLKISYTFANNRFETYEDEKLRKLRDVSCHLKGTYKDERRKIRFCKSLQLHNEFIKAGMPTCDGQFPQEPMG